MNFSMVPHLKTMNPNIFKIFFIYLYIYPVKTFLLSNLVSYSCQR